MNDFNRNTRTLIVCFVVAIMVLVPLRFMEVGAYLSEAPQVLGEEVYLEPQVVLPNIELTESSLEMPYSEIDGAVLGSDNECLVEEEAAAARLYLEDQLARPGITEEEVKVIVDQLSEIEAIRCR